MNITLQHNKTLNLFQWDYTVNKSINTSVFGFSWLLDVMDPHWHGLIANNYEHVMPVLLTNKGSCISTIGKLPMHAVYSRNIASTDITTKFLRLLTQQHKQVHITLDKVNKIYPYAQLDTYKQTVYELDLIASYTYLQKQYPKTTHNIITNLLKSGYYIRTGDCNAQDIKKLSSRYYCSRWPSGISSKQLISITSRMYNYRLVKISLVLSRKGEIAAMAIFLKNQNYYYIFASAIHRLHTREPLMLLILDQFLKANSEKPLTLRLDNMVTRSVHELCARIGAKESSQTIVKHGTCGWFRRIITAT